MPSRRPSRPAWIAGPSTGRRCGASTRPTATGTWSAPAPRRRHSPTEGKRSPCGAAALWLAGGEMAIRAAAAACGWLRAGDGEVVEFGEVRWQAHSDYALLL